MTIQIPNHFFKTLLTAEEIMKYCTASKVMECTTLYARVSPAMRRVGIYSYPLEAWNPERAAVLVGEVETTADNVYKVLDAFAYYFDQNRETVGQAGKLLAAL